MQQNPMIPKHQCKPHQNNPIKEWAFCLDSEGISYLSSTYLYIFNWSERKEEKIDNKIWVHRNTSLVDIQTMAVHQRMNSCALAYANNHVSIGRINPHSGEYEDKHSLTTSTAIKKLLYHPLDDNLLAVLQKNSTITIYNLLQQSFTNYTTNAEINDLAWHPSKNYRFATVCKGKGANVQIWTTILPKGYSPVTHTLTHPCKVSAVAWNPHTHSIATAGADNKVRIWTLNDQKQYAITSQFTTRAERVSWHPLFEQCILTTAPAKRFFYAAQTELWGLEKNGPAILLQTFEDQNTGKWSDLGDLAVSKNNVITIHKLPDTIFTPFSLICNMSLSQKLTALYYYKNLLKEDSLQDLPDLIKNLLIERKKAQHEKDKAQVEQEIQEARCTASNPFNN